MNVLFFTNGNTAVFKDGEQVPELQEPWLNLYIRFLVDKGIDPMTCVFEMPSGEGIAELIKTEDGYNWRLK